MEITKETIPVVQEDAANEERISRVRAEATANSGTASYRPSRPGMQSENALAFDARIAERTDVGIFTNAYKRGTILDVTISGVDDVDGEVYWICYQGNITIRIPFSDSYMTLPGELLKGGGNLVIQRQKQFVSKAIGLTIPVVLTGFSAEPDGSFSAIASRTTALAKIRNSYFGTFANRTVKEGDTVDAQIISIGPHICYVTACGLDIEVRKHMLTHRYVSDVTAEYTVGQFVRFQVTHVDHQPGRRPKLELDARPVELALYANNIKHRAKPGMVCVGTVTSVRKVNAEDNSVVVNLFLDGINVPAFCKSVRLSANEKMTVGCKVLFELIGIASSGYPHGAIKRVMPSA